MKRPMSGTSRRRTLVSISILFSYPWSVYFDHNLFALVNCSVHLTEARARYSILIQGIKDFGNWFSQLFLDYGFDFFKGGWWNFVLKF